MSELIQLEKRGHIAVLTIANPPANTWTADSLAALKATVEELNADRNIFALVVTGQGEKFFSAGADLKTFADGDRARANDMAQRFGEAFAALTAFRGVSIAAVNGYAMGGGLECAMACDIRIAEEHAQMALPEASVGLLPCAGGTQNLPWLVGEGWAKRMILCGERVTAAKALEIGLVEEVVPTGNGLEAALKLAEGACKQSPSSIARCKQLVMSARDGRSHSDGWRMERELFVELFHTEDQKEGVNAFLEKRKPDWKNR
ncbi:MULTISPECIES: enoyl-CoA hydratase [Marinobacter]|jgi:enoyl-CoA hydratase/carnithine racemase|uniref:Enoyl-CoA hydratase/carnithine racemase n=3 Tax=Marinobacter nauticus TaxID=2743 RepID=A0A368VBS4_MARNT|nr:MULTISPECIES: enoyl-CoA hydratase [Marinobacter]ERS01219.1 enoyl-CoA hydratase [Marinobacter sp. EN3]ERS83692.1 enoyl-CoA hydratase [Marinobacter sp. EVN1]MAL34258.1 enoyl-CoA hydratase [Marinobacter sp.]MAP31069.1 enoyl-CoA hydratase [Marinobacter sp.]MBW3199563.1 enoyl-CoA hydratase [Marinobacter nauticus]|tara:strand:+ start:3934 stop:4713 length:780 start_codon:yes stop_codon:yes gene_type:complete